METYAEYLSARQLPYFPAPLHIEYAVEPPLIGRIHRIAVHADAAPKIPSMQDYLGALSTTEWRCATQIAEAVGVASCTASEKMLRPEIVAVTECRRVRGKGRRFEWRLKCAE